MRLLAFVVALGCICPCAWSSQDAAQTVPTLHQFFSSEPFRGSEEWAAYDNVEATIAKADPAAISQALPAVFYTLKGGSPIRRRFAASALVAISIRPDAAALLTPYNSELAERLTDTDVRFSRAAVFIFGQQRSRGNVEASSILSKFIERKDSDQIAQASAIAVVLQSGADDPEAVNNVANFLMRPLDAETRIHALNAVSAARISSPPIVAAVISTLDERHNGVKVAAIRALGSLGGEAVNSAEAALQRLASDASGESSDVKNAAMKVLRQYGRDNR